MLEAIRHQRYWGAFELMLRRSLKLFNSILLPIIKWHFGNFRLNDDVEGPLERLTVSKGIIKSHNSEISLGTAI